MSKELLRIPAPVDLHVHLRDMGQDDKEDFASGTRAALAGGFSTIEDKPNKKKPIFTLENLLEEKQQAGNKIFCDVGFDFGSDGKNLNEFQRVKGIASALKVFLNETTGNLKLDNINDLEKIYKAWPWNAGMIFLHAEGDMVPFALTIVEKIGNPTHFHHVSTKKDFKHIIDAKDKGLPVTCGVTPHHLFLTKEDAKRLGPFGYMKPELATQEDVDFIWRNLLYVDVIESDHAPHTTAEKLSEKPPSGVPGLETTLPLMLTSVVQRRLTLSRLIELISTNPQKILGIKLPESTYTMIELDEKYTLGKKGLETKCRWTPFEGNEVQGKVKTVYIRGQKVFDDGQILASAGVGKVLGK